MLTYLIYLFCSQVDMQAIKEQVHDRNLQEQRDQQRHEAFGTNTPPKIIVQCKRAFVSIIHVFQTFVYRNTRSSFNHSPGITQELNSSSSDHSSWIVQELNLFDLCNIVACIESTHGCLWIGTDVCTIYPLCACALYRQLIRIAAVEQMANERL